MSYGEKSMIASDAKYNPPTPREILEQRKISLTEQLAEVEQSIKLLDENPAFEKCFTALQKTLRY